MITLSHDHGQLLKNRNPSMMRMREEGRQVQSTGSDFSIIL